MNASTKTPVLATALVTAAVLALALAGRLAGLATTTSRLMLTRFGAANLALWRLKGRQPGPEGVLTVPRCLPLIGAAACAGLVIWKFMGPTG
ncbi:MAG: hypothetical protein AAFR09_08940 [Pseudomonadota bacterium]